MEYIDNGESYDYNYNTVNQELGSSLDTSSSYLSGLHNDSFNAIREEGTAEVQKIRLPPVSMLRHPVLEGPARVDTNTLHDLTSLTEGTTRGSLSQSTSLPGGGALAGGSLLTSNMTGEQIFQEALKYVQEQSDSGIVNATQTGQDVDMMGGNRWDPSLQNGRCSERYFGHEVQRWGAT